MISEKVDQLLKSAESLSSEERLRLIASLLEQQAVHGSGRRRWQEICGSVPYPLLGEDAQAWVSRSRQEDQAHRDRQLQSKS